MTALDIITRALKEIGVLAQGETADSASAQDGLDRLNAILDTWSARRLYTYAMQFQVFTLTPNLSPHTIGPSPAKFVVPQRPVRIESAAFSLPGSPSVFDLPINIRDHEWWANERVKGLTSSVVTDLYYEPDWPNGSLFFWPVPTVAYQVKLELWTLLSQIPTLQTAFSLPPGYNQAITLTLAEQLTNTFDAPLKPKLVADAMEARRIIQSNNIKSPRMATADSGMPDHSRPRGSFNWQTGNLG